MPIETEHLSLQKLIRLVLFFVRSFPLPSPPFLRAPFMNDNIVWLRDTPRFHEPIQGNYIYRLANQMHHMVSFGHFVEWLYKTRLAKYLRQRKTALRGTPHFYEPMVIKRQLPTFIKGWRLIKKFNTPHFCQLIRGIHTSHFHEHTEAD